MTSQQVDLLQGLAAIAATLTGFSGLAAAVRGQVEAGFSPRQRLGFWVVVSNNLAVLFGALIPIALDSAGLNSKWVWCPSALLLATYILGGTLLILCQHRRLSLQASPAQFPYAYIATPILALLLAVPLIVVCVAPACVEAFGIYYACSVVLLICATIAFVLFLRMDH